MLKREGLKQVDQRNNTHASNDAGIRLLDLSFLDKLLLWIIYLRVGVLDANIYKKFVPTSAIFKLRQLCYN